MAIEKRLDRLRRIGLDEAGVGMRQVEAEKVQIAEPGCNVTVHTQVYANGPDAAVIEIVDPRDLIEGLVRRRASYLWRSFYFSRLRPRFALQKINGAGATWLPKYLALGWQKADLED